MKKVLITALCLLLVLTIGAGAFWYTQKEQAEKAYRDSHVFIGEDDYPKDAKVLDLRGKDISLEYHDELQSLLPECTISWSVPFQNGKVSWDVTELTITELDAGDVEILTCYFPQLSQIHAENCEDYEFLARLMEEKPDWTVDYSVSLSGKDYHPTETKALTLEASDAQELLENLAYLPEVTQVHFSGINIPAEELLALVEAYPNIAFSWEKTVLGVSYSNELTELDLSGTKPDSIEALEAELAYFPNLTKVTLGQCGLDSETLSAYRDRVRDNYKVVWDVLLGGIWTPTDVDTYMPTRENVIVSDADLTELKYCEDLIVIDLGHMLEVSDIDFLYHMPKLQFLILVDTQITDLTPIGTLKELIYLELFRCPNITDYSPLLGCTALQDLNLAHTYGDVTVLAQMTWLDSLWANHCGATEEQKQLLRDSLPDTLLELNSFWWLGGGWRDRPNYYVMRDILGMKYIPTGAFNPRYN